MMNKYNTFEESISVSPNVIAVDAADTAQGLSIPDCVNYATSQVFWIEDPSPSSDALARTYKSEAEKQWENYSDDPEIATMSEEEIIQSIISMAGKWADRSDIKEDWLEELRNDWGKRLNDLFNLSQDKISV